MDVFWCDINKYRYDYELIRYIEGIAGIERRNYLFTDDKVRHLIGITLVEYAWCKKTLSKPQIIVEGYGKPYFKGLKVFHNIHFNISHSGNIVLCAVGNIEVGVDIEEIKGKQDGIVNRYFSKLEKEYCNLYNYGFYKIWTRKESYLKLESKSIIELEKTPTMVEDRGIVNKVGNYEFIELKIHPDYEAVICMENMNEFVSVKEIDNICINTFMKKIKELI